MALRFVLRPFALSIPNAESIGTHIDERCASFLGRNFGRKKNLVVFDFVLQKSG